MKPMQKMNTEGYVDQLIDATSKLILHTNEVGHFESIEALPSKAAPPYLTHILTKINRADDDDYSPPTSSTDKFNSSASRSFEELQIFRRKIQDEDRLSNMYKLRHSFSSRFDNRAWLHPHGTTNYDYQAIPAKRQAALERYKNRVRKENYKYLCNHPEIQGIISLFLKKLLAARPQNDATDYLAEFFITQLKDQKDFEEKLEDEVRKISRYHVGKMKASGKINLRRATDISTSSASGDANKERPETDVNFFKKMNIGPLAADFTFDSSCLMSIRKRIEEEEEKKKLKQRRRKKKPREYCGCKDWKLKKNRQPTAESSDGEKTTTFSTLGNVATLRTSEEEETEDEEEESTGKPEQNEEELTEAEAERIASQLVHEFLDADGGVYSGHHHSLGAILKNIQ